MIYHGDLFNVLPKLPKHSIDACATDPPYGIGVMGKEWDTFVPEVIDKLREKAHEPNPNQFSETHTLSGRKRRSYASPSAIGYDKSLEGQRAFQAWTESWAREVFRVLKPGAHVVVCGAPRSFHRMTSGLEDAGFVVRDCFSWLYGQGFPKSLNLPGGLGTALKPSWEPIVLARKPLVDTLEVNHEIFGTGALNIDACRITFENMQNTTGRWPPNVLLDETAAAMLDEQTGIMKDGTCVSRNATGQGYDASSYMLPHQPGPDVTYGGSGGGSRFMYVAKPSGRERDEGCYDLPLRTPAELTGRKEGSAGLKHARAGTDRKATNFHPTVKPVSLMEWLVKLITPPGGTVLDPFMGSGTTGMAARLADMQFIGVEREAEYVEIAWRRISETSALFFGEEEVIK